MLRAIIGADELVARTVESLLGHERPFVNFTAIGVANDDHLLGGVVFHDWSPEFGTVQMSAAAASPRWLTRPIIRTLFAYPFDQIGCQVVVLRVAETNKRMRRIARAIGCREVIIPRLRGRDEGEAILTLTDDDWKAGKFMRKSDHG